MVNRRLYHSFVKRNGSGKLANISFVVKNGMFNRRLFMALLKVTYFWSNPGGSIAYSFIRSKSILRVISRTGLNAPIKINFI